MSLQTINIQKSPLHDYFTNEDAQGITEYGAVLCFVSLLIAMAFTFTNGSLANGILKAFSAVNSQLNSLSNASSSAS